MPGQEIEQFIGVIEQIVIADNHIPPVGSLDLRKCRLGGRQEVVGMVDEVPGDGQNVAMEFVGRLHHARKMLRPEESPDVQVAHLRDGQALQSLGQARHRDGDFAAQETPLVPPAHERARAADHQRSGRRRAGQQRAARQPPRR